MTSRERVNPLQAAFGLFTSIPTRPLATIDAPVARGALLALPWVGLGLGSAAAVLAGCVSLLGGGPLLAAVVAVAALALATGALHLDGLADTADGLGSRRPRERALEIMRRSDIGPMGVATLVLVLLIDVAAASGHPAADGRMSAAMLTALAAAPMVGRVSALLACRRGVPGARREGFGALFADAVPPAAALSDALAVCAGAAALGWLGGGARAAVTFALAAVGVWLLGLAWERHLVRRLGGMTGDTLGSLISLGECAFLVVTALTLA